MADPPKRHTSWVSRMRYSIRSARVVNSMPPNGGIWSTALRLRGPRAQLRGDEKWEPSRLQLQGLPDCMTTSAVVLRNVRIDFAVTNALGQAEHAPLLCEGRRADIARYQLLNTSARYFVPD